MFSLVSNAYICDPFSSASRDMELQADASVPDSQ